MEADQYRSGTPKKSKTEDVYCADSQLDLDKVGLNSRKWLPMKATGKEQKSDGYCLSVDVKDKLVVPDKKLVDNAQVLSDGVPLAAATNSSKKDVSIKKRKLEWTDDKRHTSAMSLQDGMLYGEDGCVSGFRKEKKYRVLKTQINSDTEGDNEFNRKCGMSQICLSGSKDHMAVNTEVRSVDKAQREGKHRKKVASQQTLHANGPLGRDLGSGQHSLAATSSSSLISGSHKARTNFEDIKISPVESITSSPPRTSNFDKLIFTEGDTSRKDAAAKCGCSSMSSVRCLNNKEEKQSTKRKKGVSNDLNPGLHIFSSKVYQVEDGKGKVRAKTSSEVRNVSVHTIEHGNCANGTHNEDRVNRNNQGSAFSWQESGKVTSLWGEEKNGRSDSEVVMDKMKILASENGYPKNGRRFESKDDLSYHDHKARYNSPKSKRGVDNISKKISVRSCSSESVKQIELKPKDTENSALRVDVPCSPNGNVLSRQNLNQNFEEEDKDDCACTEFRDGKIKVLSSSEGQVKRDTLLVSSRTGPGSQKGGMFNGHSVHASGNGDVAKSIKSSVDAGSKVGINRSSGNFAPDPPLNRSSPVRANSSQTASIILHEATKLKDTADQYKVT